MWVLPLAISLTLAANLGLAFVAQPELAMAMTHGWLVQSCGVAGAVDAALDAVSLVAPGYCGLNQIGLEYARS